MAASNEWTEWHLTPKGWERGSEKEDFAGLVERPRPLECVMTVVNGEKISSSYSGLERSSDVLWRSGDTLAVETLLAQYGNAPSHL